MPNYRFQEWYLLEHIEPFGEAADYLRTGTLCALLANVNRDPEKYPSPFEATDFMPDLYNEFGEPMSTEEIKQFMLGMKAKQDAILKANEKLKAKSAEVEPKTDA